RRASVGTRSRKAMSSSMLIRTVINWRLIFSDLPSPAEASTQMPNRSKGFAQAGNRCPLFGIRLLLDQFVATAFGHQNGRSRGIALDFLAQTVNVSLEGVRRDARVVTPDFLQQDFARNRALTGAIEIAQDRGFLLGQPDFVTLRIDQQFGAGPERVGA